MAIQWNSTLLLKYGVWEIPTEAIFVLDTRYLYPEKKLLIEALENWLLTLEKIL